MHYYPHHIGDFIRDTSRLNDSQCMAYLRLIWMYYENEEPLPDNTELLAFKIGSDKDTVAMLLQCYFYANAMRWHHKRIDSELSMYKDKSEKAKNSAKARWNNANAMRTHSEGNANGMLTNNQEPLTNNLKPIVPDQVGDACPHQQIINLYHEHLPMLTRVKSWTEKRAHQLRSRWREDPKRQNLEYWEWLFAYVAQSDFLTGKTSSFQADLEWITKSANFVKIIEGRYENKTAPPKNKTVHDKRSATAKAMFGDLTDGNHKPRIIDVSSDSATGDRPALSSNG